MEIESLKKYVESSNETLKNCWRRRNTREWKDYVRSHREEKGKPHGKAIIFTINEENR